MISFSITDIKFFMNKLLKEDTFNLFEVRGVEIYSFTKFEIDGFLEPSLLGAETSSRSYCTWQELKPYVFNIIKGNVKPRSIKIIFSLDTEKSTSLHNNAAALYLNMHFVDETVTFTTGTSQKNFALDKSLDNIWEEYIRNFFKQNNFISTWH